MLLPIAILVRESASEMPTERHIGINPDSIARVEDGIDEGTICVWADGTEKPYVIAGTVDEFVEYVNYWMLSETEDEEGESCELAPTNIE